jgi:photosystem II stability/assembly factor-like uncharacterized protein
MTDELLDLVRAVDPLPEGSTGPPFEPVYEAFTNLPENRQRHRRGRLIGLLAPTMGIAIAVGVILVAVTLLHAGPNSDRHAPGAGHGRGSHVAAPTPRVPTGGMSGFVTVFGAGFDLAGNGLISVQQCLKCQPDGNETSRTSINDWLMTTSDGGRSWTRSKVGYYLQRPFLSPEDGWAGGLQLLSRAQAGGVAQWEPGAGRPRYFVTRDGGRTWSVAHSAEQNQLGSSPSLGGGEVWAMGFGSNVEILHGSQYGDELTATASQPIQGDPPNVHVMSAGSDTAYVIDAQVPQQAFVTHDSGRTWARLTPPPCTGKYASANLDAAFLQTVWVTCAGGNDRTPKLVRSADGGRSWRQVPGDWGRYGPQQLAANGQVAWALNTAGVLLRTTNAGATWQPVWSPTDPHVSPLSRPITKPTPSPLPIMSVQSADSASIVTVLNRGTRRRAANLTNLVVYRTTNGGQTWETYPVKL